MCSKGTCAGHTRCICHLCIQLLWLLLLLLLLGRGVNLHVAVSLRRWHSNSLGRLLQ
jgi:hypothetical protein